MCPASYHHAETEWGGTGCHPRLIEQWQYSLPTICLPRKRRGLAQYWWRSLWLCTRASWLAKRPKIPQTGEVQHWHWKVEHQMAISFLPTLPSLWGWLGQWKAFDHCPLKCCLSAQVVASQVISMSANNSNHSRTLPRTWPRSRRVPWCGPYMKDHEDEIWPLLFIYAKNGKHKPGSWPQKINIYETQPFLQTVCCLGAMWKKLYDVKKHEAVKFAPQDLTGDFFTWIIP